MIWFPTRITGFSDVIGSWNTIAICVPQYRRIALPVALPISRPSKVTLPCRRAFRGSNPMIERDRTDLPQPDSPTIPIVLPRSRLNDTPSTACTRPRGVLNCVLTSSTSSNEPSSGASANRSVPGAAPRLRRLIARSRARRSVHARRRRGSSGRARRRRSGPRARPKL